MRLLAPLALCIIMVAAVQASFVCKSKGGRAVKDFNGRSEDVRMPCKYHAVRQVCGDYFINLTPGNRYMYPKYRLDTLWLGVANASDRDQYWNGRTSNKLAVKFFNGMKNEFFNTKGSSKGYTFDYLMKVGREGTEVYAMAKNGDFKVTFRPWDPKNNKFSKSDWSFECLRDSPLAGFPTQICGGTVKTETQDFAVNVLGVSKKSREEAIYYTVFTDKELGKAQTNPLCEEATNILVDNCTEEARKMAITTCKQILHSQNHLECVTKYSCDPMEVYVNCLRWVCGGFQHDDACYNLATGIDMCREFKSGNLTQKVMETNCYKDFIPIDNDALKKF